MPRLVLIMALVLGALIKCYSSGGFANVTNACKDVAARQFLADRIMGKDVEVRYSKKDRYGRVLGIVYLNGEDINLLMVREGMAWHYSHFDHTPAYAQAHEEARAAKRGLWADPNPVNPYDWRKCK